MLRDSGGSFDSDVSLQPTGPIFKGLRIPARSVYSQATFGTDKQPNVITECNACRLNSLLPTKGGLMYNQSTLILLTWTIW